MHRSILFFLLISPAFGAIDFAHQVVPILKQHCAECHLGEKKKGSLSMNTRKDVLAGSENGTVVTVGNAAKSLIIEALTSRDKDTMMPPKGARVPKEQIEVLTQWINEGLVWEEGFTFGKSSYEPPLKPRVVLLPPSTNGRTNPIDRILDKYQTDHRVARPGPLNDREFARRVSMDLIGLLPDPARVDAFVASKAATKRDEFITDVLARDVDYAEHWMTMWNDLLRNDYVGTGYIEGGRKPVTNWLYQSLVANKPFDVFARDLLAPSAASEGFTYGIKWRGTVNASQTREVQFAQSICQVFLGINMKCASCHDSFIDRWKLDEAYGLAAIYSDQPIEINRCDKGTGRMAQAAWIFPELGNVKPDAPQSERLKQLAALMTHKDNGRFTRTIVNRLWHRLMGHGIVHPVDAMHTEPWCSDLLDYLAVRFTEDGYDVKKMLALIASSHAYQSKSLTSKEAIDSSSFVYQAPLAKRLTAEQFVDAVWQLTKTGPKLPHASVVRGKPDATVQPTAKWIWRDSNPSAKAGQQLTFRKLITLTDAPIAAKAVITADNEYQLFVNNRAIGSDTDLRLAETYSLTGTLRKGANAVLVVAKNGGPGDNPAGAWFQADVRFADDKKQLVVSDDSWEWSASVPDAKGKFVVEPKDWKPAAVVTNQDIWKALNPAIARAVAQGGTQVPAYVRASLVTSDLLMRALGRPNRDQIVTVRPENLTTLEAIDLENGSVLAGYMKQGAAKLVSSAENSEALIRRVFGRALSREPTADELKVLNEVIGDKPSAHGVEDLLWSVLLLPEFQFVR